MAAKTRRLDKAGVLHALPPGGGLRSAATAPGAPIIRAGRPRGPVHLAGRTYAVREVLSEGRSGEADLFVVSDGEGRQVLKRYRHDLRPKTEVLERVRHLDHPNVVRLLAYGYADGAFCEVMELAAGGTLEGHLPLDDRDAFEALVRDLLGALEACHARGIVHRDVKPANVFCRHPDGTGFMLGDFGISSFLDGLDRRVTLQRLTVGYAAPETFGTARPEADGRVVVGPPADFYSLGLTLLEAWTGRPVFDPGLGPFVISDRIRAGEVELPEAVPDRVRALVRGLTHLDPAARWGADEVRGWLEVRPAPEAQAPGAGGPAAAPEGPGLRIGRTVLRGFADLRAAPPEVRRVLLPQLGAGGSDLLVWLEALGLRADSRPLADWEVEEVVTLARELPWLAELGRLPRPDRRRARDGWTPLLLAVSLRAHGAARTLLALGADPDAPAEGDADPLLENHPLHLAAALDDAETIRLLAEAGADPDVAAADGWTALHVAALHEARAAIGALAAAGADLEAATAEGVRPLHVAVSRGDTDTLAAILDAGADPDACWDPDGWTPLHHAASDGRTGLVRVLLAHGASPDARADPYGSTPLQVAVRGDHLETAGALLDHGADPRLADRDDGIGPLHLAALEGHARLVTRLIAAGADPAAPLDAHGWTLLHEVVRQGHAETAEVLLAHGADPDAFDTEVEQTPLHVAVRAEDAACVRVLLAGGADPTLPDGGGRGAAELALDLGHPDLARLLTAGGDRRRRWAGAAWRGIAAGSAGTVLVALFLPDALFAFGALVAVLLGLGVAAGHLTQG